MDNLRIKIAGKVLPYKDLKDNPQLHHDLFEKAKRSDRPKCLCSQLMPELYIGKRVWHYLAKMPGTGYLHDPDCPFYETVSADSGKSGYDGAFQEEDGLVDVKLSFSLTRQRESKAPAPAVNGQPKQTTKRGATGLLGLLHFLWEHSKNNQWFPYAKGRAISSRSWSNVAWHLNKTASQVKKGKSSLQSLLHVIPPFDKDRLAEIREAWERFIEPVVASATKQAAQAEDPQHYRLVLGELGSLDRTDYGYSMTLRQTSRKLYMSNDLHAKLLRSYAGALAKDMDSTTRTVCLALVAATENGYITIIDAAMMRTTHEYIPVDSSYEVEVARMLVADGRRFEKPLRYECAELTLPDFILLDAESPRVPMEIYGMTGHEAYDVRKAEKRRYYAENSQQFWEWTPTEQKHMQPFPEKVKRRLSAQVD